MLGFQLEENQALPTLWVCASEENPAEAALRRAGGLAWAS